VELRRRSSSRSTATRHEAPCARRGLRAGWLGIACRPRQRPDGIHPMPRIPARLAPLVFAFWMSTVMSLLMSLVITAINTGVDGGLAVRWLRAWLLAWPIAFVVAATFRGLVQRLTAACLAAPPDGGGASGRGT
jgi:hypothetical protein